MSPVKLTQLVKKGGCAAKVSAAVLREILAKVKFPPKLPEVVVDGEGFDDAAVYDLGDGRCLVQTLDFFTPIVDSPRIFGQVAAANALSDIYAMGGTPTTCMAILTFSQANLDPEIVTQILNGATEKIAEAGACLVGGHSVDDETLKFGLSVTGFVPSASIWTNAGAQVGDVLILTKPLGTGTLCAGLKSGKYTEEQIAQAIESMARLNSVPTLLSEELHRSVHAATDVTGFGLAGHAMQLAQASAVSLEVNLQDLPTFTGVLESLATGNLTRAHTSNRNYTEQHTNFTVGTEQEKLLVTDPQTSGGLLLSVDSQFANEVLLAVNQSFTSAAIIGSVKQFTGSDVYFR